MKIQNLEDPTPRPLGSGAQGIQSFELQSQAIPQLLFYPLLASPTQSQKLVILEDDVTIAISLRILASDKRHFGADFGLWLPRQTVLPSSVVDELPGSLVPGE